MSTLVNPRVIVARSLPVALVDKAETDLRVNKYGELVNPALSERNRAADDGGYFVATNPTPSTAIAYGSGGTNATFSDTVPFMNVVNTAATGGKRVYLDYLKLIQNGTAPASTTSVHYAIKIDNVARTATAGTPVTHTPVNANMGDGSGPVSRVIVFSGAVATVPAASAAARLVARGQLKGGPTLNLDEYNIVFGGADNASQGGYLTTVASYCSRSAPVVLDPGCNAMIYLWFLSGITNPFSYEYELGIFER